MISIHRNILQKLTLGLGALLLLCGSGLYFFVWHALVAQFDDALLKKADVFAAMSEQGREVSSPDEQVLRYDTLAPSIQEAMEARAAGRWIAGVERLTYHGQKVYKVELQEDGIEVEFLLDLEGNYLEALEAFDFDFVEVEMPEYQPSREAEYFQVWDEDADPVVRSPSLEGRDLPFRRPTVDGPRRFNLDLPDGRSGRAVAMFFVPRPSDADVRPESLMLVMARSRETLDRTLAVLLTGLLTTAVLLLAGGAAVARWTVDRGLSPLDRLARRATELDPAHLQARFPTDALPAELHPISARLNDLMDRIETAFARERRFSANVAHELRTPVSELRTLVEVSLHGVDTDHKDGNEAAFLQDVLCIAQDMERLVDTLLTLARCEAGMVEVDASDGDLSLLLSGALDAVQPAAAERQLVVKTDLVASAPCQSDRALLSAMMRNILGNAVSHAPEGSEVTITLRRRKDVYAFTVSNADTSLREKDLPNLFDPLWRKDDARSRSAHLGVGLAVVQAFARLLGISVVAELPQPGTFSLSLEIPLSFRR